MTLFLTETDVNAVFDWTAAVEALRAAYTAPLMRLANGLENPSERTQATDLIDWFNQTFRVTPQYDRQSVPLDQAMSDPQIDRLIRTIDSMHDNFVFLRFGSAAASVSLQGFVRVTR